MQAFRFLSDRKGFTQNKSRFGAGFRSPHRVPSILRRSIQHDAIHYMTMLPFNDILHRTGLAAGLAILLGLAAGCQQEFIGPEKPKAPESVYMSAAVSIRGVAGTINTSADKEDRVKTVRVIICDSPTGAVLYNKMHSVTDFTGQPEGQAKIWSNPFKITEGQRDFFFIANEEAWNLTVPLTAVNNRLQLFTDNALTHIPFPAGYRPTEEKPMLMTRAYRNVAIKAVRNSKGTSQGDPQHFIADGDEQVELIRSLAKVKLTIESVVNVEEVGGVPKATDIQFKRVVPFKGISLVNVPKYFSLFVNPYFDGVDYPANGQFSLDFYTAANLEETIPFTKDQMLANSEAKYLSLSQQPGLPTKLYDYVTSYYVPEHLRRVNGADPATPGFVPGSSSFYITDGAGKDYYKFSIWQNSFTEGQQEVAPGVYYSLPNAANYSKFSTVRNNVYDISAVEGFQLVLNYKIEDWCTGRIGRVYAGYGFNVVVDEPSFPGGASTVRILTAEKNLVAVGAVELVPLVNDAKFSVGGKESNTLRFGTVPEHKDFQAQLEGTLTLPSAPAKDTPIFQIKYNNKVVYTVKSE